MTEKPKKLPKVYARITGFAGLPNGGDVFLTEGDEWDPSDPYKYWVITSLGRTFFTTEKPKDASDG